MEEAIKQHQPPAPKVESQKTGAQDPLAAHPHVDQNAAQDPLQEPPRSKPKVTRVTPPEKQAPEIKYKDAKASAEKKGEWGSGEGGYKPPIEASDKMRLVALAIL